MKIVLVIKALGPPGGGAERVLATLASGLAHRGHDVTVITSDAVGVLPYYRISDDVRLIQLGIGDVATSSRPAELWGRLRAIRRTLYKLRPSVVIAFMHPTFLPAGLAALGSSIPVIASEHTAANHYYSRPLQRLLLQLTPIICKKITVVSEQVRQSFGWWMRRRMVVVPNPIAVSPTSSSSTSPNKTNNTLLTVGRLGPEKQHAILISAFAKISADFPDWTLRIVGEGELRATLETQVASLELVDKVMLVGSRPDVTAEYAAADLFVLPSSYESFGMATAEALLHGLPAVGFADCPGTNELIRDGENGRLVIGRDRTQALADTLAELMGNTAERHRLANSPREWIKDTYGVDGILDLWESTIVSTIQRRRDQSCAD